MLSPCDTSRSVSTAVSTYTRSGELFGEPLATGAMVIANAVRLTVELLRISISGERAGNRVRTAVIWAFSEKAHASADAHEIAVFIPTLPAGVAEITLFYSRGSSDNQEEWRLPTSGIRSPIWAPTRGN
ncbi:hypothetical protein SBA4_390009 [Candidatus Sulfopaludibacter sp. SbA4]|nr:hypothetical protein SBA4_390009 [Candidatus Sulfopaludibacter sp. SbA4]